MLNANTINHKKFLILIQTS